MTNSLRGQVAVVTGTDSGVGRSAAEMLLRAGAHVTMICLDGQRGQQALDELSNAVEPGKSGRHPSLEIADLSCQSDVRAAAHRIAARSAASRRMVWSLFRGGPGGNWRSGLVAVCFMAGTGLRYEGAPCCSPDATSGSRKKQNLRTEPPRPCLSFCRRAAALIPVIL